MSNYLEGALFVDYNFRIFYKGIRFEDRSPDQLTLDQMNSYGDFAEGDTFVLKVVDNQILLEKQFSTIIALVKKILESIINNTTKIFLSL